MIGCANPTLVPLFSEMLAKKERKDAWRFAWTLIAALAAVLALLYLLLLFLFEKAVVPFASGFTPEMGQVSTTVFLIGAPSMVFAAVAASTRTLVQCLERFVSFSLGQAFGVAAGILALVVLRPYLGIHAAAVALSVCYIAEFLFYVPTLAKEGAFKGFRFQVDSRFFLAAGLFGTGRGTGTSS